MAAGSDYFATIQELLENAEEAYTDGNFDEALEYMEELRDTAISCMEELERLGYGAEVEEEEDE